ncbi:hypothetical protein BdPhPhi1402_gp07 [Bdellovibrio phage phi1402]|uniref:hypothetical protein n=1 Tax=Bdellovibrio phage phi1402 TaxID=1035662 RepID=UPI000211A2C5|nr:hypothetical protein BdPhPhi1402_gp07 [Bdellovibrio phage phi1402]AEG42304.1 hypothetical protein [Bdellovibrio phage phi1402]
MKKLTPVIIKGTVQCPCPKCGDPYEGELSHETEDVVLECQSCGHSVEYYYRWPDEMPPVTLRYKSSGQLLSGLRSRPRRKKKKKTDVLKGQMAFEGVLTEKHSQ